MRCGAFYLLALNLRRNYNDREYTKINTADALMPCSLRAPNHDQFCIYMYIYVLYVCVPLSSVYQLLMAPSAESGKKRDQCHSCINIKLRYHTIAAYERLAVYRRR